MWLLILLTIISTVHSTKVLKQSICLFRHGSRLPNTQALIPGIFASYEHFGPGPVSGDLTDDGELQMKTLGKYYSEKLTDDNNLLTGNFENDDDDYSYFRSVIDPRVAQSLYKVLNTMYPDNALPFVIPERVNDLTLASPWCTSFGFVTSFFNSYNQTQYLNLLFNASTRSDLNDNVLAFTTFTGQYIINLGDQITCYKETNSPLLASNSKWQTLMKYRHEIDTYVRLAGTGPYIWGGLNDGAYAQGYDWFKQIIDQMALASISGYSATSLCRFGPCKFIVYSTQGNNIKMLAHQLGLLTLDGIWHEVPMGTSICFDLFQDSNTLQYKFDINFGGIILNPHHNNNLKKKYSYAENKIQDVDDKTKTSTQMDSLIAVACEDAPYSRNCNVTKAVEYLNSRKPVASTNDCCSRNGHMVSTMFENDFNCDAYTSVLTGNCATWRSKCPGTACDIGQVYSPALSKCATVTSCST